VYFNACQICQQVFACNDIRVPIAIHVTDSNRLDESRDTGEPIHVLEARLFVAEIAQPVKSGATEITALVGDDEIASAIAVNVRECWSSDEPIRTFVVRLHDVEERWA
jgi:hypothetical protein